MNAPERQPSVAPAGLFIDASAARQALDLVRPLLESAADNVQLGQSGVIYVVVMDPSRLPGQATFDDAVLLEQWYGKPRDQWDADYGMYARAKATISWRTGLDSYVVQTQHPHRLQAGDLRVWGSVCIEGFVVALSGLEPEYDEALAGSIALALRAVARRRSRAAA